jgi:hypothetical protein
LALYRDGGQIVAKWAPDPPHDERIRPVRFIEAGELRFTRSEAERVLHELVEAVIDRLNEHSEETSQRLRDNWRAVCESRRQEPDLCCWAAALGLDPYDPDELTDEIVALLEARVKLLGTEVRRDLLEATSCQALRSDLDWLTQALAQGFDEQTTPAADGSRGSPSPTAHQLGYQRAESFRAVFGVHLGPISDLSRLLTEQCGWPAENEYLHLIEGTTNFAALVGKDSQGRPQVVGPALGHWAQRFRLARALYFLPEPSLAVSPRLVTKAYTWDQRASRAFAAELLAPAEVLRHETPEAVSWDFVDHLSKQFDVRPNLIVHQLVNHQIARLEEF